jgi:hypothetical protein
VPVGSGLLDAKMSLIRKRCLLRGSEALLFTGMGVVGAASDECQAWGCQELREGGQQSGLHGGRARRRQQSVAAVSQVCRRWTKTLGAEVVVEVGVC